jgi:hypothetical protein
MVKDETKYTQEELKRMELLMKIKENSPEKRQKWYDKKNGKIK